MNATRYGVIWPDGSTTGDITDSPRLARAYAKTNNGTPYQADEHGNPITGAAPINEQENEPGETTP